MNGRSIIFIFAASGIMMLAMTLQNKYAPQRPIVGESTATVAQTTDVADTGDSTLAAEPSAEVSTAEEAAASDQAAEPKSQAADSLPAGDDTASDAEPVAVNAAPEGDAVAAPTNQPKAEHLLTIGSLNEDGKHRYLITVNRLGGTIRRAELNFRELKKNTIRYRDLDWKGGYLGHLELSDSQAGPVVGVVGPGTPADTAGVRANDVLKSLNETPITSAADFQIMLAETKPGDEVQLAFARGGKAMSQTVALTRMPIELLRPEVSRVAEGHDFPESFVLSLIKPVPELDKAWPNLDQQLKTARWDIDDARTNDTQVALTRTISAEQLESHGISGPIKVTKIYALSGVSDEDLHTLASRSFHWTMTLEIVNESDQTQTVAYELDGPTGATAETWWYANKIHGRSTAIGYLAGARDVVGGSKAEPFVFFGGPEIADGSEEDPPEVNFICSPYEEGAEHRQLLFAGVDTQYFNISLIPKPNEGQPYEVNSLSAYVNGPDFEYPENARLKKLIDCTFQMVKSVELAPNVPYRQTFDVFAGPKEPELLSKYELSEVETYGWFAMFSKPALWLLHFFYFITFKTSYGLAIIMLTVLVRCLMIPFSRKAALNAQMMQHLQPEIMKIKKQYPEDMQKQSTAQRELFNKYNYSPLSGCLPMFLQLPIFLGLYRGLSVDVALRDAPLIPGVSWCSDLSAPDQLMNWQSWMPSFLADETGWLGPFLNILPVATMVVFIFQQKLFMPKAADEQQKMMQSMMSVMMPIMGLMFFKVPAGLCLYIITSSLWGIAERLLLPKPVLDTSKFEGGGSGGKLAFGGGPQPTDDSAAIESKAKAEREQKKRENAERKKRLRERK